MGVKYAQEEIQEATALAKGSSKDQDVVGIVKGWMSKSDGERAQWRDDQSKWYKLRMRIKKKKDYPFPNCSNIRLPTLDNKIKKLKAQTINSLFGIRPLVQAVPAPGGNWQTAIKIEKFLDHLLSDVMCVYNDMVITIDQAYEKGFFLQKVYWKLETQERIDQFDVDDLTLQETVQLYQLPLEEACNWLAKKYDVDRHKYVWADNYNKLKKAAEKILAAQYKVTITTEDVTYNFPSIALISPDECYVPSDGGYDPQNLPYFIHEFYVTKEEAQANVTAKGWDINSVEFITTLTELIEEIKTVKDNKEGVTHFKKTGKLRVAECFGYVNGKRQCITIFPDFNKLAKQSDMPTPTGRIPVVKYYHELREDRWYHHRSLADIIEDLVKEIDIQHMQKIDRQTIVNSPKYVYRAGLVNTQTTQFMFGQGIPVQGMQSLGDIIAPLNDYNQAAEFSYDREQQILKAEIDEYTGQVDYTLSQQVNRREPRTAEEVAAQSQLAQVVTSLDSAMFRQSFEQLVNLVFEMWCEYGDDEYEFSYFGENNYEPIKLTKEELQGKYKVVVRANDNNTNPRVRLAKAREILQSVVGGLQIGVTTPINVINAYKRFFQELDVNNAEELYTMPQPKQPGVPDKTMPKFEDLEEAEQSQILMRLGIKPDHMSRVADKMRQIQNERSDNITNIVNTMK